MSGGSDVAVTPPNSTFERDLRAAADASTLLDLPASAVQALLTGAVEVQLPPAAMLYRDADRPRAGLVVRGLVRVYMTSPEGRHITVRYARPGDILGIAVGVGGPAAVSVATVVESALAMFDLRRLEALARSDPRVGWWAAEEVTRRLYETLDELAGTVFLSVRRRVARHLLDLATERRAGEALVAAIGQQDLADAVGSVREVVSRALAAFRDAGLVETRRDAIIVLDPARLADEARPDRERDRSHTGADRDHGGPTPAD